MSRRMIRGKYNDGVTIGMRISLTPCDALTDDSSIPGQFAFDSTWTDIIHPVLKSTVSFSGANNDGNQTIPHSLGYTPFVEVRLFNGNTVWDDTFNVAPAWLGSNYSGVPAFIDSSNITIQSQQNGPLASGNIPTAAYAALYIVYPVALDSP